LSAAIGCVAAERVFGVMRAMEARSRARISFLAMRNELMVRANKWIVEAMLARSKARAKAALNKRKLEIVH
jgi:hypothetical protein